MKKIFLILLIVMLFALTGCIDTSFSSIFPVERTSVALPDTLENVNVSIPAYTGTQSVVINGGVPFFVKADLEQTDLLKLSPYDNLGRTGVAVACLHKSTLPTGERGDISLIKPAGFVNVRYDGVVDGGMLYNRCHMIGWQLCGDDSKENLITGTRSFNLEMLPFENEIASVVRAGKVHVLLRVTPLYNGNELVCRGVLFEAISVEDSGKTLCINVFIYNVENGIDINYSTGASSLADL